jgi:hypothetical protein
LASAFAPNRLFYGLGSNARVGSIPIARSTLRLRQTTLDNSPKSKSMVAWEGLGIRRRFPARFVGKLTELENRYDRQFKVVFDAIRGLMMQPEPKRRGIGFTAKFDD